VAADATRWTPPSADLRPAVELVTDTEESTP
jgi:hypothetical protein